MICYNKWYKNVYRNITYFCKCITFIFGSHVCSLLIGLVQDVVKVYINEFILHFVKFIHKYGKLVNFFKALQLEKWKCNINLLYAPIVFEMCNNIITSILTTDKNLRI